MVRASLVDDDATVRSAAAKAFDVLQEHLGAKAIDQTIPTLLEALRQPGASSDTALQALREVMSVCLIQFGFGQRVVQAIEGSRVYGVPRPDPNLDLYTYDGFQCQSPCVSCHRCWYCPEQAPECYPRRISEGFGR